MPVLNPAEIWQRSGRYGIPELFKLQDRRGAELVLAMTHEEAVTTHVAPAVRSYRDLPFSLYHFQVKERDEPRPRAGVLRTREFIMKDAYTFDRDREGLDAHYERYREAYDRIFDRVGIEWYRGRVRRRDDGRRRRARVHGAVPGGGERRRARARLRRQRRGRHAPTPSRSSCPTALPSRSSSRRPASRPSRRSRRRCTSPPGALLKAYPVIVEDRGLDDGRRPRRPPRQRHQARERARRRRSGPRARRSSPSASGRPASSARSASTCRSCSTTRSSPAPYITGANRDNAHLRGVEPGRDFPFKRGDVRSVEAGDTVNGHPIRIEPAIEVGNIFKLGTRYSEQLGATYLDENGKAQPIWMGSYGLGPARITAAAVEQFADENGISWPRAIAPFDIHLVGLGKAGSDERERRRARSTASCSGTGLQDPLRRPRRGPGGEVRRRRAARRAGAR